DVRIRFTFAESGTVYISGYTTEDGLLDNFNDTLSYMICADYHLNHHA
ncbi:unnamed protein product, partial [marine sediment metagenome]